MESEMQRSVTARNAVREFMLDLEKKGCLKEGWGLLTALRGNDDNDNIYKGVTTTEIRRCLFSRAIASEVGCAMTHAYGKSPQSIPHSRDEEIDRHEARDENEELETWHFRDHYMRAREVLDKAAKHDAAANRLYVTGDQ